MKKWIAMFLAMVLLISLAACGSKTPADPAQDAPAQPETAEPAEEVADEPLLDYTLSAEEAVFVEGKTFDESVTVTAAPSSRNGGVEERSTMIFADCTLNGGVTVIGDYNAMIIFEDCTFGPDNVVTVQEATAGISQDMTLEDSYVKINTTCDGLVVESESAMGIISGGPDFVLNGETYSKAALAPDTDYLGVYTVFESGSMEYVKLGLGEDDSVVVLD